METWSWQWLSSLRRMPRPLSRRRQLTTKPRFLAVIDTSVWEAKQMRMNEIKCNQFVRCWLDPQGTCHVCLMIVFTLGTSGAGEWLWPHQPWTLLCLVKRLLRWHQTTPQIVSDG
ncbi:uncharacterized protein [Equus caballus]|uniref:uncharacterized protein isoform X5 n=1 Tax=Equus caballus TaxID=9796 RepID=UPI0038B3F6B4